LTVSSAPPHQPLTAYYRNGDERQAAVNALFDDSARHYEWICRVMSLGTGSSYRRLVLAQSGLVPGMTLLDVAVGTGVVAREAVALLGDARQVVGLDPSAGMLRECRRTSEILLVQGQAECLPFRDGAFDFVSMGYALRHVSNLGLTFREYHRVLKRGGRAVIMEIIKPRSRVGLVAVRFLLKNVLPLVTRVGTGSARAKRLMQYYWDTIANCVPPEVVEDALTRAGFVVERRLRGGILTEYRATKGA
jgi:demethylmenaquinone methyltransferase / 2-methoxy-6-polyprenyl-1,4-benzoquinol methylase